MQQLFLDVRRRVIEREWGVGGEKRKAFPGTRGGGCVHRTHRGIFLNFDSSHIQSHFLSTVGATDPAASNPWYRQLQHNPSYNGPKPKTGGSYAPPLPQVEIDLLLLRLPDKDGLANLFKSVCVNLGVFNWHFIRGLLTVRTTTEPLVYQVEPNTALPCVEVFDGCSDKGPAFSSHSTKDLGKNCATRCVLLDRRLRRDEPSLHACSLHHITEVLKDR